MTKIKCECGTVYTLENNKQSDAPYGKCPICGSDQGEEGAYCRECGKWEDDLPEGFLCIGCLEDQTTFHNAERLDREGLLNNKINDLYTSVFSTSEINEILKTKVIDMLFTRPIRRDIDGMITDYCLDDATEFQEKLIEWEEKNGR